MKQLSIEEKAKLYDEAKINGSRLWECGEITRTNYEFIFPELKESEDERIRREILDYIIKGSESCYDVQQYGKEKFEKWIAWLEKQGQQKYTQRDIDDAYLKGIADVKREVEKIDEQTEKMKKEIAEFIFNSKEDIKQRYEWIKCLGFDVKFSNEEKQGEQNPAWSEEDDNILATIIEEGDLKPSERQWLKSIKDRVQPQNTWKPSDEQMEELDAVVADAKYKNDISTSGYEPYTHLYTLLRDLKKLREW